ncbi:MAG: hypothetical protein KatS3mg105_0095 [Gemmatales bacterium]|nr:MAG: hypothetical protein KatS3mg105_0095 [Gemmatales bacterium]
MVQTQFRSRKFLAAVLAHVVITRKNVTAVELHRLLGELLVSCEPNDPWHLDSAVDRANPVIVLLAKMFRPVLAYFAPCLEIISRELSPPRD